jgi:hypothetical protein
VHCRHAARCWAVSAAIAERPCSPCAAKVLKSA